MSEPASKPRSWEKPAAPADAARASQAPRSGGGPNWLALGAACTLVILAGGFVAWLLLIRPVEKAAGGLREAVASALQRITGQQVAIHSNTVTLQKANISELNLVQRRTQTITKLETTAFGSKATLILRGDFIVKAGFDLEKPFSIQVDEATGEVKADFPPAKITSVELKNYEVFFSDSGLLNKITPELHGLATQQMLAQARLDAEKSDIKADAEAQLHTRLRDLLGNDAKSLILPEPTPLP